MDKVNVLYVVGRNSFHHDMELKMSLRLLEKHGGNLGDVIIAGYIPSFVDRIKTECFEIEDYSFGKHWNILNCILTTIGLAGLSDDFLYSSDDHFLMKDCDLRKWKRYTRGDIYDEDMCRKIYGGEPSRYQRSIIKTKELLMKHGKPVRLTCWHGNTWMNPRCLEEVKSIAYSVPKSENTYGYEPTLLFSNCDGENKASHDNCYTRLPNDVKAYSYEDAVEYSKSRIGAFSVSDGALKDGRIFKWLNEEAPHKSRWEK